MRPFDFFCSIYGDKKSPIFKPIKRRGLILDKLLEGPQDSNCRVAYDGENYYKTQSAAPLVIESLLTRLIRLSLFRDSGSFFNIWPFWLKFGSPGRALRIPSIPRTKQFQQPQNSPANCATTCRIHLVPVRTGERLSGLKLEVRRLSV